MTLIDVYAERKAARVEKETWGHLAPEPGRAYPGTILFAEGEWGDLVLLRANFTDLPDSPWFYDALQEWQLDQATKPGGLYRFTGTYRRFRNGRHRFAGRVEEVDVAPAVQCATCGGRARDGR
jgi:hypothetical protein